MKKINVVLACAIALSCAQGAAFAQSAPAAAVAGPYVGIGIGKSDLKADNLGFNVAREDRRRTSAKVYGGYQFMPNLAAELQYFDLGNYEGRDALLGYSGKITSRGISAAGVGYLPLTDSFSLLGKAGVAFHSLKGTYYAGNARYTESANKTTGLLGVGAEYKLTPNAILRGEFEYFGKPEVAGIKARTSQLSVGLRYKF